jgi:hypothetical protein
MLSLDPSSRYWRQSSGQARTSPWQFCRRRTTGGRGFFVASARAMEQDMAHALFILGELTDQDVDWMVSAGTRTQISAGTELIHEGQPASALYILLDGALEVSAAAARRRQLAHLGKGEVVGEMSFVDARPPSATVRATEDSLVLAIPLEGLRTRLEQETAFASRFPIGYARWTSLPPMADPSRQIWIRTNWTRMYWTRSTWLD